MHRSRGLLALAGLAAAALLYVALVLLGGALLRGARLDLTENRLYTLSPGTQRILGRIEEPVRLYFFFSAEAAQDYPELRTYAQRVRELLEEMAVRSRGRLKLETIDPQPFSDAEDRATGYGLQGQPLGSTGEMLYFGIAATNATDGEAAMPFLQPDKEAFLEYDIAKLISTLTVDDKPVIGLSTTLPMGPGVDPATGAMGAGWAIDGQLRELFELRRLQPDFASIGDDVDLLMLVHPKKLGDDALYAIDQFVLRGGRLLAFVDPDAEADPAAAGDPMAFATADRGSTLGRLFQAWGVEFDPTRVVLDRRNAMQVQPDASRAPVRNPLVIGLGRDDLNQDDVVSAQLEAVNFSSSGYFGMAPGATAKLEPLAQSSGDAATEEAMELRALPDPSVLYQGFTPADQRYVLAARLTGALKTAFPERKGDGHLAAGKGAANVILVADTDVLSDQMWVQTREFFGQRLLNAFANNGDFVFNAADNLTGNANLISVRTRAASSRPFDTVQTLRRQAEERYRAKEQELQAQLAELERKLTALQAGGSDGANDQGRALLMTPAQQTELQRFQDDKLRIRKELRQVRRQLDADIERLGRRMKLVNIAGVPLLVAVAALVLAWLRRRRRETEEAPA